MVGKTYKRPGKSGWWLRWTDPMTKKRITKSFHTKALAEHYRNILYQQLNADVFISTINIPLSEAKKQYLEKYETRGFTKSAKQEAEISIRHFQKFIGSDLGTKNLTQRHFDTFIQDRQKLVSCWTVNKDINNLRAFINWASNRRRRYVSDDIELYKLKTQPPQVTALTTKQIRALIKAAPTEAWRIRILISLVTGLRKSDVESLRSDDLDLGYLSVTYRAKKTGKQATAPLPTALRAMLKRYIGTLDKGQVKLFADCNVRKVFDSFRGNVTRQNLRQTFATLMQKIGGLSTAQNLLQHSNSKTTQDFYTDQELILRWKVNQLPVKKWITCRD